MAWLMRTGICSLTQRKPGDNKYGGGVRGGTSKTEFIKQVKTLDEVRVHEMLFLSKPLS